MTAIVGPNGAGKTTYFNLISGQLHVTAGSVLLGGEDITRLPTSSPYEAGTRPRLPAHQPVPAADGPRERAARRTKPRGRRMVPVSHPCAPPRSHRPRRSGPRGGTPRRQRSLAPIALSHGDQRKLEVALLMALDPDVYMFDEPTAGMSVDEMPTVLDLIKGIKKGGDPHNPSRRAQDGRRAGRSPTGSSSCTTAFSSRTGSRPTVIASPVVQEAYLGVEAAR